VVVDDWSETQTTQHDNWRKELADAGRFAPGPASTALITPAALPAALCRAPISWMVGFDTDIDRAPFLAGAPVVARNDGVTLWRIDRAAGGPLNCAGMPNDDSADR